MASQVQLILSRDLARDIIEKLKLGERPEFDPVLHGPSLVRTLLGLIGIARDPMSMTPEERVLKSFQDRLNAYQAEKSRVIVIEFESADPELAAQVANAVAAQYLVLQRAAKQAQTRAAGQWLAGEIDKLRTKVADAEAKVERYRSKTSLFIGTNNLTLSNQQLGDYNGQLAAARAQKADAEAKARLIRDALRAGAPIEFSDITNSELLRRLSEQRVTLRAQLAEQSSTLLAAASPHQGVAGADRRSRSADPDRRRARGALAGERRQAGGRPHGNPGQRPRSAQAAGDHEQRAGRAAARARARCEVAARSARILSRQVSRGDRARQHRCGLAGRPRHLDRDRLQHAVLAEDRADRAGGGARRAGALGRLCADQRAARRHADARPPHWRRPPSDPAPGGRAGKPARAPGVGARRRAAAASGRRRAAGRRSKRSGGRSARPGRRARRITVVGAARNVGTTVTAITLARSLARQGRVVLVDLALGNPDLSVIATDPSAPGIADLIRGTASYGEIITRDRHSRVHLVMAGRAAADADAIIASQRLSITLEALARSYDHLVIDAGALPRDRRRAVRANSRRARC